MRKALSVVTSLLMLVGAGFASFADTTWELSVQVSATVQANPPQITLSWPQDVLGAPNSYSVFRKSPGATSWGNPALLPGTATVYVDKNVGAGVAYEYQVVKQSSQYNGYGYILAGIDVPLTENRGKLLLVVDNTYITQLANELNRLQSDLTGDGWTVIRMDVARNDSPANIKNQIRAQYAADPANVKCVFLFGHVPVPYSGNIVPDGHSPEHQGAWPADGYYGDMDGEWTDNSVNTSSASEARNRNVPGDGKFDQSNFPSALELVVGRVDLANMPGRLVWGGAATFPSEVELLRNYLNKNHKFRQKQFDVPRRALVGDYFGYRDGEAFAASGWRNFAPFFGSSKITDLPNKGSWIPTLKDNAYLWAYGCGAGSYTSIGGLGNTGSYQDGVTPELVQNDAKAVFTLLFGSWLGDWDSEDNIQRAVLALPSYGLACGWSGRPHWFLHHMAMGETIGFGTRLTQNNASGGLYRNQVNNCAGQIHIALMGDPTLRMHAVAPPTNVRGTASGTSMNLSWAPAAEAVQGYHVYRRTSANGPFSRLSTAAVPGTTFTDTASVAGAAYLVRSVKQELTASGTYQNLSQGAFLASSTTGGTGTGTNPVTSTNSTSGGTGTSTSQTNTSGTVSNTVVWVDDALPAGAVAGADGGDAWTWVTSNPSPFKGTQSHQSSLSTGLHQHYFSFTTQTLAVGTGELLFAYVYLDPANPPKQIMLQWNNGDWEHRAYWGANLIQYGTENTAGRRYMGSLPPVGQWVRLQVPASQVGLEGSTLRGMAFSQFDGRATWDYAGKTTMSSSGTVTNPPTTGTNTTTTVTPRVIWVDEGLPAGAQPGTDGGDSWTWTSSNPAAYAGRMAHQSIATSGLAQHFFTQATTTMSVMSGESLFSWVYLDPANPPSQIMLQWFDGNWEHRAYWGANQIGYGANGTSSRRYMGPLPATGQWILLQVPANQVSLEGSTVSGMAFSIFNGRATWDYAGVGAAGTTTGTGGNTKPDGSGSTNSVPTSTNSFIWVDDAIPSGAQPGADGGDNWKWVTSNPAPISGSLAHQTIVGAGLIQHYFTQASQKMQVSTGEVLFANVYIDPNNLPDQIMLQWNDGTWDHRAYWGNNRISYGQDGTASRRRIGALPVAGQWVRLEVPASQVGLEGSSVSGMAFSIFNGRATWDAAGKAASGSVTNPPGSNPPVTDPSTNPPGQTNNPSTNTYTISTNSLPGVSLLDYVGLELPKVGDNALNILSPNLLELKLINTKQPDPARVTQWDVVDASGQFVAPPTSAFAVTANGQPVSVAAVGFKRRPLYAPASSYDLRIENSLYLQLATPLSDNQVIEVKNPTGTLWSTPMAFVNKMDPLRYSAAIHVNQEGYMPNNTKKAMVGYYLGSMGEMAITASTGFKVVNAETGAQVFQGSLVHRMDVGYSYTPNPYQKVYEADFTGLNTPGEYRLIVPGMGASLPFIIDEGVAMAFARTYALGLYHQRCGTGKSLPFTRHTHDKCHVAAAKVPMPADQHTFTWNTIAGYANSLNANNPSQTAPALTSPSAQLFPFVKQGSIDVSGGHHDAGDYSKYTINSASLVHYLMFTADALAGVSDLDNLGLPESGDGISDVLQEAKWEADFLAKIQDSDGGFYFLVYPQNREYEGNVAPDKGDAQVVWPKTTSVTAAAVAALAQCASSPKFKKAYPAEAALYLQKAQLGWQFLMNALAKHGQTGAYQKITHYGDNYVDRDELAWAACEMFLATGDAGIHAKLKSWFDPSDPATWRWGWWRMSEGFGHAIRSYAFAVRTGRMNASQLDAAYLAKCEAQAVSAGDDTVNWSKQNAYGSSFPENTKRVKAAGWYFSTDQAFDIAVAQQISPKADYINAMLANMNFEGGCNPVNVTYVTGLGWKRQRDVVSQWAVNDRRVLPPSGEPVGNITANFSYLWNYGSMLDALTFPSIGAAVAPYPFYDRWGDSWNVNAEFVVLNQARSLGTLAYLAARSSLKTQPWKPVNATLQVPGGVVPVGKPVTIAMQAPGVSLEGARITWEARDQEPAFGQTFTFVPKNNGVHWVEAEAQLPDGRRLFAAGTFNANSPDIIWFDDSVPAGSATGADGGDAWTWVTANPPPRSGSKSHQSALAAGQHQHWFDNASATLEIAKGDTLYAWVYLDPATPPAAIMLQWNDGTWDHRAYWGANLFSYGANGTASRMYMGALPAVGQWVQLKIPASAVGLEGSTLKGMAFTLFGGRATWDAAGRLSAATVTVSATGGYASRIMSQPGSFTLNRTGELEKDLTVHYALSGNASLGKDYQLSPAGAKASAVTFPPGVDSAIINVEALARTNIMADSSVVLTLLSMSNYLASVPGTAMVVLAGNTVPSSLQLLPDGARISWKGVLNRAYQVAFKTNLSDAVWTRAAQLIATNGESFWHDADASNARRRFYAVAQVD